MKKMQVPYVISQDIHVLLSRWSKERNFILPSVNFFSSMRKDLSTYLERMFDCVEIVSENELSRGITLLVENCNLYPVSIDKTYYLSQYTIEITREVDKFGNNTGIVNRFGSKGIKEQIKEIKDQQISEVILVDDVMFNGDTIESVIHLLEQENIHVPVVCCGIVVGEGMNKLIKKQETEVLYVKKYNKVIDEICERDFYPGVPFSGRTLAGSNNVGAPYILPFGNPVQWASIPTKWKYDFSRFCLEQTIVLFEEIENASNQTVMCTDLDRQVATLKLGKTRFIDELKKVLW